jgi:hypothetical protein
MKVRIERLKSSAAINTRRLRSITIRHPNYENFFLIELETDEYRCDAVYVHPKPIRSSTMPKRSKTADHLIRRERTIRESRKIPLTLKKSKPNLLDWRIECFGESEITEETKNKLCKVVQYLARLNDSHWNEMFSKRSEYTWFCEIDRDDQEFLTDVWAYMFSL